MEERAFRERYVAPFYMDLMNLNFVRKPASETLLLFNQLKERAAELSDEQLTELLNDYWRPSKAGAWMIGLSNREELLPELIQYISNTPVHHCQHALMNILIIRRQNAGIIISYFLEQQCQFYLKKEDVVNLERLSIDWALSILAYLDQTFQSNYLEQTYTKPWWMEFQEGLKAMKYYESLKKIFLPDKYLSAITTLMERHANWEQMILEQDPQ